MNSMTACLIPEFLCKPVKLCWTSAIMVAGGEHATQSNQQSKAAHGIKHLTTR
jgi:hypothetical protein